MDLLKIFNTMARQPGGKWLFSRAVAAKAPYFQSIAPRMEELSATRAVARLRKRRSVTNHIGTVHAIAICNLAEFAAGVLAEVACPPTARWIPQSMSVEYLAKAGTDLRAQATFPADLDWAQAQTVPIPVDVQDTHGTTVFRAEIRMYCSPKRAA